jgi:hypothetical protein
VSDRRQRKPKGKRRRASSRRLIVRRVPGEEAFELVHPACVKQRAEDLEEVRAMLEAGEVDVAVDELRWLLRDCRPFLEVHKLLGDVALADGDLALARGHFGRAYELGLDALPERGLAGPLPYARPGNRAFFEAGKGLAQCLHGLGESRLAGEVVERLLAFDEGDPLGLRGLPAG